MIASKDGGPDTGMSESVANGAQYVFLNFVDVVHWMTSMVSEITRSRRSAATARDKWARTVPDSDAELLSGCFDVQIEKDPQHQHFALTVREPLHCCQHSRIHAHRIGGSDRIVVVERVLMPATAPPRRARVKRSTNNPRPRSRMTTDPRP